MVNTNDNFSDSATGPAGLVSVVVVCAGQLEYTRLSVSSLLRCSRQPCELLFIDVASLDGTREFLQGVATASSIPVRIIGLNQDCDFASAYAIGVRRSAGEYVVLLNNDTIVPHGWLNQLIGLVDYAQDFGMVGCMSNHAPPLQSVGSIPYRPALFLGDPERGALALTDAVNSFAKRWREENEKKWFETERLDSFCLLLKRRVLDDIGATFVPAPLGISSEELSARVRRAGYRLACCRDLFIHHFGTRLTAQPPPENPLE